MPYARPTLTQLRDAVLQDIAAAQITNPTNNIILNALMQKAVLRDGVAYPFAGLAYEHYGFQDYIALQSVPWTATDEFLEGWGALKGVLRQPATKTIGQATFTGTNGTDIPPGTAISRSDGVGYTSLTDAIVAGGSATVTFQANTAGSGGNFDGTFTFTIANGIAGVTSLATSATQTMPGTDVQTDASLRSEILLVYAAPPQGGDRTDYIEWALSVAGVTRAWIDPNNGGPGAVLVYTMFDVAEATHGGFPQGTNGVATNDGRYTVATGDQADVANFIWNVQPVTALVVSMAPVAQQVPFVISNLGANATAQMQTAITQALTGMFLTAANVGGAVIPSTGAPFPPLEPSAWYSALSSVPGLTSYTVVTPAAPITPVQGALLVLGSVTLSA